MTASPVAAIAEADWARAVASIGSAAEIWLACHVRPDADALGSMLAVANAIRAGRPGTAVAASFGEDPFEVPGILRFLPGQPLLVPPAEYAPAPPVMVCFDAASLDRLGSLTGPAIAAGELIVLDHHSSAAGFGTIRLVDPAAAATAMLAAELITRLGVPLSQDIAVCLYAGLVTDTGSFKYSSTTPQVHELAARLLATGIDPSAVARELYDRAPFGYLRMLAAALDRAVLEPAASHGRGLVWTSVRRADRAPAKLPLDAAEPVIDVLRRTDEAEVAVVLKEDDQGCWQVSMRSKEVADVGAVAVALGGGGHARAAGFSYPGPAGEAVAAILRQLGER